MNEIYKVTISNSDNVIAFGFNRWEDAIEFMRTAAETVDGFESGKTTIILRKTQEVD